MAYQFIILFFIPSLVFGAACCGGASGNANLITGDYKAQFNISYSNKLVTHTVDGNGDFILVNKENQKVIETSRLTGSYLLSEYWQFSATLSIIKNSYTQGTFKESTQSLTDPRLQLSYEFLPELYYSHWKPRGFLFVGRQFQMGKSIYDSKKELTSDATSIGYSKNILGLSFYKKVKSIDASATLQYHISERRTFSNDTDLRPGNASIYSLGLGYSFRGLPMRLGGTYVYSYEEAKVVNSLHSQVKMYSEIGVNLSYSVNDLSYSIGLSDQSFLGKAKGILAGKSLNFGINYGVSL